MELHRRYQYTAPAGEISEVGIRAINKLIGSQRMDMPEWQALNPDKRGPYVPSLPQEWDWNWIVPSGLYRGTMPKRVAQFYFKQFSIKVPQTLLAQIGNLARAHSAEPITYEFEIVDEFEWYAGKFGDSGSCYWGGRSGARQMLQQNGGRAICFYQPGTSNGIARAWLVPVDAVHILFNGYGFTGDSLLKITRMFADWRGEVYQRIYLSNNSDTTGVLYINGGRGYVVGSIDQIAAYERYDFEWDEVHSLECYSCEDGVNEDDAHPGPDGNVYCEYCYHETFDDCEICGRTFYSDDLAYIEDQSVCDSCRNSHYTVCDECGEETHNSNIHTHQDRGLCENCYLEIAPTEK